MYIELLVHDQFTQGFDMSNAANGRNGDAWDGLGADGVTLERSGNRTGARPEYS